jgi:predicted outer membrane repeat protein
MYSVGFCSAQLVECEFTENVATWVGGAMFNGTHTSPTLNLCTFTGNYAPSGGAMNNQANCSPTLEDCVFSGNEASIGGAMRSESYCSPSLTRCTFTSNTCPGASGQGGGVHFQQWCDPTFDACTFQGNIAGDLGGAANFFGLCDPTFTNCVFSGNQADTSGGGLNALRSCNVKAVNCTFEGNDAVYGAAIACDSPYGPGYKSTFDIANSILWDGGGEVWANDGSVFTITYSDVQGGHPGTGNITGDPQFANTNGPDGTPGTGDEELHLTSGSPCINAGSNTAPGLPGTDIDGNARVDILDAFALALYLEQGRQQNMAWDLTGDGKVDRRDVTAVATKVVALGEEG